MPQYKMQFLDQEQQPLGRSYMLAAQNVEWAAAQATRYAIPTLTAFLKVENIVRGPADSVLRPFP